MKPNNALSKLAHHTHIIIASLLYITCLFYDAYYLTDSLEPTKSIDALLIGWLGIFDFQFSWYANGLFFFSILLSLLNKSRTSIILSFSAICLILSFLLSGELIASEAPTYKKITGYGIGYFLWLLSATVLFLGEYLIHAKKLCLMKSLVSITVTIVGLSLLYSSYFFIGPNSLHKTFKEKQNQFTYLCNQAKSIFYQVPPSVKSVFINDATDSTFEDIKSDGTFGSSSWSAYLDINTDLDFIESFNQTPNEEKYIRKFIKTQQEVKTNDLQASYEITATSTTDSLPKSLGLQGEQISIKDRTDQHIIAQTTYVVDTVNNKVCASFSNGKFSISEFINQAIIKN